MLQEPYCVIVHHLEEVKAFRSTFSQAEEMTRANPGSAASKVKGLVPCSEKAYKHIGMLVQFLQDNVIQGTIEKEEQRISQDPSTLYLLYALDALQIRLYCVS